MQLESSSDAFFWGGDLIQHIANCVFSCRDLPLSGPQFSSLNTLDEPAIYCYNWLFYRQS